MPIHKTTPLAWLGLLGAVALVAPSTAHAGALGRPNIYSALGVGLGGAGYAGVPNPTTVHFNPAGLMLMPRTEFLAGLEMIAAPRSYEPLQGDVENNAAGLTPVPSLGVSTRLAGHGGRRPMPFALGFGFYNSFGGAVEFDPEKAQPGITESSITMLEMAPAAAYQVTRKLAVGVALRIGFGTFNLVNNEENQPPQPLGELLRPSDMSGSGVQVGATAGITYQALQWLRIGATYGSPMRTEMKGDGQVKMDASSAWAPDNVTLVMPWPQWAALGTALSLGSTVDVYAAFRWTDWSSFDKLFVKFNRFNDVIEHLDFSDGFSAHLGAEWRAHSRFAVRGGVAYDSNTVPDKSVERQYLDADKVTVALGGWLRVWDTLTLDVAYEALLSPTREVTEAFREDEDPLTGDPIQVQVNTAPGRYSSSIHTVAMSIRYAY